MSLDPAGLEMAEAALRDWWVTCDYEGEVPVSVVIRAYVDASGAERDLERYRQAVESVYAVGDKAACDALRAYGLHPVERAA